MHRIFPKPLLYHGAFSYFTETSQNSPKLESDFKGKEGWIGINSSLKTLFFHSTLLLVSNSFLQTSLIRVLLHFHCLKQNLMRKMLWSLRNTHVVIVKFSQTILMGPSTGSRERRHHFNLVSSRTET